MTNNPEEQFEEFKELEPVFPFAPVVRQFFDSKFTRAEAATLIPHLGMLSEGTEFKIYAEAPKSVKKGLAELTIFYREPGKAKVRIDAQFDNLFLEEGITPAPQHIRILGWKRATEALDEEWDEEGL